MRRGSTTGPRWGRLSILITNQLRDDQPWPSPADWWGGGKSAGRHELAQQLVMDSRLTNSDREEREYGESLGIGHLFDSRSIHAASFSGGMNSPLWHRVRLRGRAVLMGVDRDYPAPIPPVPSLFVENERRCLAAPPTPQLRQLP